MKRKAKCVVVGVSKFLHTRPEDRGNVFAVIQLACGRVTRRSPKKGGRLPSHGDKLACTCGGS